MLGIHFLLTCFQAIPKSCITIYEFDITGWRSAISVFNNFMLFEDFATVIRRLYRTMRVAISWLWENKAYSRTVFFVPNASCHVSAGILWWRWPDGLRFYRWSRHEQQGFSWGRGSCQYGNTDNCLGSRGCKRRNIAHDTRYVALITCSRSCTLPALSNLPCIPTIILRWRRGDFNKLK